MLDFFTHRRTFLALSIFLPLWLTVGRGLLGSIGWVTFMMVVSVLPLIFPLAITLLYFLRPDVRESQHVYRNEAVALWVMFVSLFLGGFFIVDGGDTEASNGSVFTVLAGGSKDLIEQSAVAAYCLALVGLIAALICLIDAIRSRRKLAPAIPE